MAGNIKTNTSGYMMTSKVQAIDTKGLSLTGTGGTGIIIANDGKVGIGTIAAPSEKLDVNGKVKSTSLQITTGFANGKLLQSDPLGNAVWTDPAWTISGSNVYRTIGNVGIGTNPTTNRLEVSGTVNATNFTGNGAGLTNVPGDNFGNHIATQNVQMNGKWLSGDGGNEGVFVSNAGYVGIGIENSNQAKLHINADDETGLIVETDQGYSYGYGIRSLTNNGLTKALAVINSGVETFMVYGNGKTYIDNTLYAKEIEVRTPVWGDYVFDEIFNLKKLEEVEEFIINNHHLPEVPSAKDVIENGINLGEMDKILLTKIEELTLYIINLNKTIKNLEIENQNLSNFINNLKTK